MTGKAYVGIHCLIALPLTTVRHLCLQIYIKGPCLQFTFKNLGVYKQFTWRGTGFFSIILYNLLGSFEFVQGCVLGK